MVFASRSSISQLHYHRKGLLPTARSIITVKMEESEKSYASRDEVLEKGISKFSELQKFIYNPKFVSFDIVPGEKMQKIFYKKIENFVNYYLLKPQFKA
mmetsp:Transcript_14147/g.22056  ORF Transcript_14147/g.22056 Transcript_14147/m.22056 type:complete len:99 (-) Transcript_14147:1698-1994(-)